jgi:RNA polymerase sigma-70 factor (ECF subfamily)
LPVRREADQLWTDSGTGRASTFLDGASVSSASGHSRSGGAASHDEAGTSTVPDEVLVRQAALGEKTAFAQLVRRHGPALYRYVLRLLGDPSDAEDCVQEVMVSAWRNIGSFRGDSSIRTWFLVLGRNEAAKLLQRNRPQFPRSGSRPTVDFDDAVAQVRDVRADPARDTLEGELLIALDAALLLLPERQRSVWLLREVEGLSYVEIASVLGSSVTVVRGLLQRARTAIATSLEEWR